MNIDTENQLINLILIKLGKEKYALSVDKVYRIISTENTKQVINTPQFIRGIVKLEDKIVPVIDLYIKYNLGEYNLDRNKCIVILQLDNLDEEDILVGIVVDDVLNLIEVSNEKIMPVPIIEIDNDKKELFNGAIEYAENIVLIINPHGIFNQNELNIIKNILKSKK